MEQSSFHASFTLLIMILIFSGILTIVSVIFMILSLANGQRNKGLGWGAGFVISLAFVIFATVHIVHRVANKIKSGVEWSQTNSNNTNTEAYNDEQVRKDERQEWLDSLQMHNIQKYEDNIPPDFYINKEVVKDSSGTQMIPFLYPFQIRYNSNTYTGDIIMSTTDSVLMENVSQISFDENFAIVKTDNSQFPAVLKTGRPEAEYFLLDLRTRNFEKAPNVEKLQDLATRIGFTGPATMQYLSDACRGWVEYPAYD